MSDAPFRDAPAGPVRTANPFPGTSIPGTANPATSVPGTSIPAPSGPAPANPVAPGGPLRSPNLPGGQPAQPQRLGEPTVPGQPSRVGQPAQPTTPQRTPAPTVEATRPAPGGKGTVADTLAKKSGRKPAGKQVRLRLVYVDFWSALKLSFLAAVAIAIVTIVSFFLIHFVLNTTGLIDTADEFVMLLTDDTISLASYLGLAQVMSFGAVVAILNLVVVTVLGAVVAGVYNMAVKITGGLLVGFMSN